MDIFETTINTLEQLKRLINNEDWTEINLLEVEDNRYTIALNSAISGLKIVDQCRWERDIATEQLHELGLDFGQKVDGVYLSKEEYDALLEYKYMYEDLS